MLSDVSTGLVTAQWALLLGLAVLVIVMYRQLAYLLQVGRAIAGSGGLEVGERAPEFEYLTPTPDDGGWERRAFAIDGTPTLLMFTHPGCGSCELALENLQRIVEKSQIPVRAPSQTQNLKFSTLRRCGRDCLSKSRKSTERSRRNCTVHIERRTSTVSIQTARFA